MVKRVAVQKNNSLIDNNIKPIYAEILSAIISLILVFFGAQSVDAASLILSPSSGSYHQGENFTVSVLLNTDQPANAVYGIVAYPTKYINVISVNNTNSIIDFWVNKPSFSNFGNSGNITFEGIILNPGFTGSGGKIANIVFRAKEQGSADIKITELAILANDGLGTNIASVGGQSNFVFTSPLPPGQNKPPVGEKVNIIDKKLTAIDDKLTETSEEIEKIKQQIRIALFAQEVNFYKRINNLWEILPLWIKFITVIIASAIAMLLLIIFGLAIVMIIWFWNNIKRKLYAFIGMAEKEIKSDVAYSYDQFKKNYHEATQQVSIKIMIGDYFYRVWSAIKRFFKINNQKEKKISKNEISDEIPENKENALLEDKDQNNHSH